MNPLFGFFGSPGPTEMIIIGAIAVLLFGSRLPEVGRSLGRSLIEFKKGLNGIDDSSSTTASEDNDSDSTSYKTFEAPESEEPSAPQFTPPAE